ncbi:unnamed protein product [Vitrella brassicaformis CCMP3155]|uniref:Uncharacterized protein n=1 Tax=Vitrella brassicaformis (strain CCMP3155) TaxID=1169540 RepID=A0A0G4FHH4_VITBC|nr:unnamed protein product [Vitrella brassicaformis CCMP3155]|eukprot:CEM12908.1 unnamed protein product [Vitrella brassicaformis CCMP3155]
MRVSHFPAPSRLIIERIAIANARSSDGLGGGDRGLLGLDPFYDLDELNARLDPSVTSLLEHIRTVKRRLPQARPHVWRGRRLHRCRVGP